MKRLLNVIVVAGLVVGLSGCQAMKDNPALGVGLGVAAGAVAASVAANHHNKHKDDDQKDQDRYRYDQSRKHHKHEKWNSKMEMCDFSQHYMKTPCIQGDGEIYR